jgi:Zn-dependent protease
VEPVRPGAPPPSRRLSVPGGGGLPLGTPFGVPVRVSPFGTVLALVLSAYWFGGLGDAVDLPQRTVVICTVVGALVLQLSVLAHEVAHCAVARRMGLQVGGLRLIALGGVSEIEAETTSPRREAAVALAGPVVSVLLATSAAGAALLQAEASVGADRVLDVQGGTGTLLLLTAWAAVINTGLAIFNLLPGLPLDGGRVARAAIWAVTGRETTGTRVAGRLGYGVAALAVLSALTARQTGLGLYGFVVAAYVFVNARMAVQGSRVTERAEEVEVARLARPALGVYADVPLAEAIRRAKQAGAKALVVVDRDGTPSALASDQAIEAIPEQRRPWVPVSSVSRPIVEGLILDGRLAGQAVLAALRAQPAGEYLVVGPEDDLLGVLVTTDLAAVLDPRLAKA